MELGTLIRYEGIRWQVVSIDGTAYRAQSWEGTQRDFVDDDPDVEVVVHPPTSWPFVSVPVRRKDGPLITVRRTVAGKTQELKPLVDWVPSNRLRAGGSIFFNPRLELRPGEVLVGVHQSGYIRRLTITPIFGSIAARLSRHQQPKPQTTYDHILMDDYEDFE